VTERIAALMEHETAGDPMTGLLWTRKTTEKIAVELSTLGIIVSPTTVARLLKQMGFSLRVNHKKQAGKNGVGRDEQFRYIELKRNEFALDGSPCLSIDAKKREMVGNFLNAGQTWEQQPVIVNDHDWLTLASGIAIPYGIYDTQANVGTVFVGTSRDTSEFAVDAIDAWWRCDGRDRYSAADQILLIADGGGSNGARVRAWKLHLQEKICDRYGLTVTVCHYPTGTSKWNPIEHRVFSEISKNWAGVPLRTYETVLNYISTTATKTGLTVRAHLLRGDYQTGVKISKKSIDALALERHATQPNRNYTIRPR
jgi:hypothetical protein